MTFSSDIPLTVFNETTDDIHAEPDTHHASLQRSTPSLIQQKTPNALQRFASNITALFSKKPHILSTQDTKEGIPLLPIGESHHKEYGSFTGN